MKRFGWLIFLLMGVMQCAVSLVGNAAEPSSSVVARRGYENEVRVAVVIGNGNYRYSSLTNPQHDATAIAVALEKLGFDVELKLDATKADMDGLFKWFSQKSEKSDVAVVFYAGHGVQVSGSNYIVPIDANPKSERDLKREMVRMDDVIDDMGNARVKIIFFDACRDNPLSRSFTRGSSRGMAAPTETTGTLISFATKHGNTASDGGGVHSPYTVALLDMLKEASGVEIEQMLRRVQQRVKLATDGQQEPWRYGSLDGDFYFKPLDIGAVSGEMTKKQQATFEKAIQETMRREREQATRDQELQRKRQKQELEEVIKSQRANSDLEIAEVLAKAKKQAVQEREALQKKLQLQFEEALNRQNAQLQANGSAQRVIADPSSAKITPGSSADSTPSIVATAKSAVSTGMSSGDRPAQKSPVTAIGDEWTYQSHDRLFGKKNTVSFRVKGVIPGVGVLEEITVSGHSSKSWAFSGKATVIPVPIETEIMFSPHWTTGKVDELVIFGADRLSAKQVNGSAKILGKESVTVPAGKFDTVKLEVQLDIIVGGGSVGESIVLTVWYSEESGRVIKQHGFSRGSRDGGGFDETLELMNIVRSAAS